MPSRKRRLLLTLTALALVSSACTDGDQKAADAAQSAPTSALVPGADPAKQAAEIAGRLSDEELIGQLLMPYAYGNAADKVSSGSAAANRNYAGASTPAEIVKKYHLGGVILVSSSADDPTAGTNKTTNVESPAQVAKLTAGLQSAALSLPARLPLLIGTDQEYGQVTRIRDGIVQLPAALAFGAAGDPAITEAAWKAAGTELAAIGLNVDFAPDADVLGAQPGGVIGSRSFGSDPAKVSVQVAASVKGLQGAGVAATVKHFPGHGHTTTDSHSSLPVLSQNTATLEAGDLPPFLAARDAGVGLIMSGHLDVKAIDPGTPASFSSKVLVDLLRTKLGYTGVVVTDALNMAPAEQWGPGEAAVRAILAGNDILLMPTNLSAAYKGLLDATKSGRLSKQRLVESATRVLALKLRLAAVPKPDLAAVDSAEGKSAARAGAAAAITIFRGSCTAALVKGPVRVTAAGADTSRGVLEDALRQAGAEVVSQGGSEIRLIGYGRGSADLSQSAAVTVALDTPYVLSSAKGALVATYSSSRASMSALADVLLGKAKATGRSPVPVQGLPPTACA
ncbi:glycoside hydrolase family 3 [Dactylosporangium vinaceum]|uniref:Glycoside hydrolase family 3 N-terminal domain-containing protein n=1 Tax=Dactylosporangium vinaceum TaxID=53362 RepID=A0ABV5LYW8_9ACTN|nr:glycoside hydrolase family 3 N-terminal domain-containing protein [Dactylosporangium vinaceum]UAB95219.1 glycoside hydrolase family 3 [Dactylosporangium vinaceum]